MNSLNILAACFASTLAISLLGFRRTVWFVSIGYTFSIAAGAALIAILATDLRIHN